MAGALRRIFVLTLVLCLGFFAAASRAAIISAGTPTTTVPGALDDPLIPPTLTSPLPAGQILVPIEITGALGLQNWSFDLTYDGNVVQPLNVGGLFQSVYAAHFNTVDTTLSGITSGGFPNLNLPPDALENIAGFSSGVTGDGLLAFVLFEFQTGHETENPGFGIDNVTLTQQAPAPGTLLLLIPALIALHLRRRITA
jgi:hypothetical protein